MLEMGETLELQQEDTFRNIKSGKSFVPVPKTSFVHITVEDQADSLLGDALAVFLVILARENEQLDCYLAIIH